MAERVLSFPYFDRSKVPLDCDACYHIYWIVLQFCSPLDSVTLVLLRLAELVGQRQ